jgi:hypothetical protein
MNEILTHGLAFCAGASIGLLYLQLATKEMRKIQDRIRQIEQGIRQQEQLQAQTKKILTLRSMHDL